MSTMKEKLEQSAPYNLFYNAIPGLPETMEIKNCITFQDLFCPSFGKLKSCLFLTKNVCIPWLLEQLDARGLKNIPLTILYSMDGKIEGDVPYEITTLQIHNIGYETNTCKNRSRMGIFFYEDNSLRVTVMSGNLVEDTWRYHVNCVWISPLCPALLPTEPNDAKPGITNFKPHLLAYLSEYHLSTLDCWCDYIKRADFSKIKVCLVASTPGFHNADENPPFSHILEMGRLLSMHCNLPDKGISPYESWPVLAQVTTVGAIGRTEQFWLRPHLFSTLLSHERCRMPKNYPNLMQLIYPSEKNVMESMYGEEFAKHLHFLLTGVVRPEQMLRVWKADEMKCTKIMPHLKTYCRISPCNTKLAWFLLTSANISKTAWGLEVYKSSKVIENRSFQLGIMFLPKFFDQSHFNVGKTFADAFPIPYDVPVVPYSAMDKPAHYDFKLS